MWVTKQHLLMMITYSLERSHQDLSNEHHQQSIANHLKFLLYRTTPRSTIRVENVTLVRRPRGWTVAVVIHADRVHALVSEIIHEVFRVRDGEAEDVGDDHHR